ncbi:hypothetical protein CN931_23925 [Bacillus sp. AFS054943]|uniref:Uncharacterized protein n=1 Tax=Bacillus cereus TaxID=1396 RepID=A0A2C1LQD0_BACCE|nr:MULTISPECIES: hypothetical protein [Bacillus]PGL78064.1 hypothetical protein CN931_23925 [Bacillus sp. AFS054943]PGT99850.1 hypothetical protein COD19_18125 [Bacillus cereus]
MSLIIKFDKDRYFTFIKKTCEEFEVPKDLYLNWMEKMNDDKIVVSPTFGQDGFPFCLQKYEEGSLETSVIATQFNTFNFHDLTILWEYRKFGYPEGKLYAIEGKRKYLNKDELAFYISHGYKWTEKLNPPIAINFSLAKKGIFYSSYEDFK